MKLTFQVVELELVLPWATARTREPGGLRKSSVVHIALSEDGKTGFGEAAPISRYGESLESVGEFLSRFDVESLSVDRLEESLTAIAGDGVSDMSARCGLEMALLDLAGKRSGRAVCELFGLEHPEPRVTSYTIGIGPVDRVKEQVLRAADFEVLKLKLGGPSDREAFAALRELAPDKVVRVDANEGWADRDHALRMIEWLATDGRVEFVEQPLSAKLPDDDHRWLFERSPLTLFADESCHRAPDIRPLVGRFHGVNVKLMKTGGLSEAVRTLSAARAEGMRTMLGCMIESSLGIAAAFQLSRLADYLDLDSHILLRDDPFDGLTVEQGVVRCVGGTGEPGLGVWRKAGQVVK